MAAVVNTRDVLLQAAAVRFVTPALIGTVDHSQVTGLGDLALQDTAATTQLTGQITSTQITDGAISTPKLAAGSVTAAKIGAGEVTADKLTVGTLSAITANLGTVTAGAISGTSTISITGTANFDGQTYSADVGPAGDYSAVLGNNSKAQKYGVTGFGGTSGAGVFGIGWLGHGVMGSASGSGKHGVYGIAKAGSSAETGVYGWSGLPTKAGVHAENSSGTGVGLKITGQMLWGSSQWASPSGTGLLAANGTWVAQSTFQPAGSYAAASHDHSGYQANGLNIFSITRNTPDNAAYSTDGGATWIPIQLKFT